MRERIERQFQTERRVFTEAQCNEYVYIRQEVLSDFIIGTLPKMEKT